jgi:glycosyltransferase involved in cell wall biosynthesis
VNKSGINIFGLPQYTLGIGEDARMASLVLNSIGWKHDFVKAPISCSANLIDGSESIIVNSGPVDGNGIDLFSFPPIEMMRIAIEGGRGLIESPRYKIGAWPWELPRWPESLSKLHLFVDEIWAQSDYVYECFSSIMGAKVFKVPMLVQVKNPNKIDKQVLGVDKSIFFFYSMFDGNSRLTRKNPLAAVRAFLKAFPKKNTHVALLIKAMNITNDDPIWRQITLEASRDSRILIHKEWLNSQSLINLMASCDALISLHRSEGFGRVLAEAMLLGQSVIATNFSGNLDFCKQDNSYLVNGDLVPVKKGEYLLYENQYWMDPDIDLASDQLLRVFNDPVERKEKALKGKKLIETNYSIASVGEQYRKRLNSIER